MSDRTGTYCQFLVGVLAALLLGGCVSTTSGPPKSEPNQEEAADLLYQLGARYYRNGQYELARDRLLMAIDKAPRTAIAHTTLALTYEQLDNKRLATESYESAIKIAPNNFTVLNTYAVFLCRYGEYDDAQKYFEKAINTRENDDVEITLTNAGVCMLEKPDPVQAEKYFRAALDQKSTYGDALIQMCNLKFREGEHLSARAFMQRYLASNPPSADVLYLGYQIEDALDAETERTEYSNRILREYPQSAEARKVLETYSQ
jgi:type IV pilus assembly protein PilF